MNEEKRDYGLGLLGVEWEQRVDFDRMRRHRLAKAQQAAKEADLDALVLLREENWRYATGVRTLRMPYTWFGRGAAVIPAEGDPILYNRDHLYLSRKAPWVRPWLPEPAFHVATTSVAGSLALAKDIKARLAAKGIRSRTLGVDVWTGGTYEAFPMAFPETEFADGHAVLAKAVMAKSRDEVACIRNACAVTGTGMEAARAALKPGVRECEVQAEAFRTMYGLGSEWFMSSGAVCSGPGSAPFRGFVTDRIVHPGEPVVISIGGAFNGYFGGLCRTWLCGASRNPPIALREMHAKARSALEAAEAAVKAGETAGAVVDAARRFVPVDGLGHGIGLSGIEPPLIGTYPGCNQELRLETGMVLYLESYAGEPGLGGIRLGDTVAVGEAGCTVLSRYPFDEQLSA